MSDEEAEYSEEEYEEEEVEEVEETQHEYKYNYDQEEEEHKGRADRAKSKIDIELEDKNLSEGEKAMLLAKKRQEEEDKLKLLDYEDRRRMEREQEDDELRKLKEKQEQRRLQREQEEREMAEKKRQEEEKRRQEEEERRARMEAERKKKEEEKLKKSQVANLFGGIQPGAQGGRNFVIPEKKDKSDRFGNIVQAKQEMGMTKEQQEDAKKSFLTQIKKILEVSGLHGSELKQKIKELHQRICKLEAEKYDLEKRHERQTYDLKELNERQRQMFRNKLTGQGVDPADANSRHPPKIRIMSKYDRQTDRRNYSERRAVFETKSAFPLFPNVPPPPTIMEFKIKPEVKKDILDDYSYGGYGEEEEVYEEEEE